MLSIGRILVGLLITCSCSTRVLSLEPEFPRVYPRPLHARNYITPADRSPSYDYVVVGGGLAGLVVASRLSDDPAKTVLVLEAGPSGDSMRNHIDVPGDTYYTSMLDQPGMNWGYNTVPQINANNRIMSQPRGRTLGGSSAINGLYIVHPPATQPNAWRDLIATSQPEVADTWGWDSIYETLKGLETFSPPTPQALDTAGMQFNAESLGTNGPLHVTYPGYMVPVTGSWLPALRAAGIPTSPDAFSGDNTGGFFALSAINPTNWTRSYSKTGWIDPLPPRSNLHVISDATVERILFGSDNSGAGEGLKNATGVRFSSGKDSEAFEVQVGKEVLLAGGAMGTPHVLLVSGVGPKDVLEAANVDVQVELPGVGQHLQDHLAAAVYYKARTDTQGSIRNSGSDLSKTPEFNSFVNSGVAYVNGSLLFESAENFAQFRSDISTQNMSRVPSQDQDVIAGYTAIHNATVNKLYANDGLIELLLSINVPDEIAVQAALQLPMSHGRIFISSPSIYDPLLIDPQYFSHPSDVVLLRQGVKTARRVAASPPLSDALGDEVTPGSSVQTDEQIENWLRENVGTEFHPCGTAAMLPRNEGGVVDARLKVYGTVNVRVVDASVFPVSFSAHMMTPVYALAEKAASIIKEAANPTPTTPSSLGTSGTSSGPGGPTGDSGKSGASVVAAIPGAIMTSVVALVFSTFVSMTLLL